MQNGEITGTNTEDFISEILRKCREKNATLKEYYWGGMLLEHELLDDRVNFFLDTCKVLKTHLKSVNGDGWSFKDNPEWEQLEAKVMAECGLRLVPQEQSVADLGFDELPGSLYIFTNCLEKLEPLFLDSDPVGKTFSLSLKLDNEGSIVLVDYVLEVRRAYPGEDLWVGWRAFDGYGTFPGYDGETLINVREEAGKLRSIMYQKTYANYKDPIWKRRKPEKVMVDQWENIEPETAAWSK